MLKKIMLLFAVVLLAACLAPVKTAQKDTYVLNTMPPLSHQPKIQTQVLLVSMPRLDAIMDNNKMVYLDGQHQMGYFGVHRWAAPPNEMFFSLLLNTLQQQGGFRAVVSIPYNSQSDLQLNIVNFSIVQDFTVRPSVVRVKMNASLSSLKQPSLLKTRAIQAAVAANGDTPEAGVVAANQAVAQCLTQIVAFVNE
ncbi:MAG: hypothetical protein K0R48_81 [Gammaproteobacteria bacterium]|jgi:ABC-type uncharacterized transport system auxiliary subunit|nr:hypothetical protein [Gammaproteobacteria bacterium]